jgi:hypothetical protein
MCYYYYGIRDLLPAREEKKTMHVVSDSRRVSLDEVAERFVGCHVRKPTHILREYRLAMDEMKRFARTKNTCDLETVAEMGLPELAEWAEAAGRRISPEADSFEAAQRSLEIAGIFFRWARRRGYLDGRTEETKSRTRRPQAVAVGSHG